MVHAEIEKNVGFDVGLRRSVGEDWSAMFLMNNAGYPCKWIWAWIEEQSPFCFLDFRKQRNRWHKSILHNALNSQDLKFR